MEDLIPVKALVTFVVLAVVGFFAYTWWKNRGASTASNAPMPGPTVTKMSLEPRATSGTQVMDARTPIAQLQQVASVVMPRPSSSLTLSTSTSLAAAKLSAYPAYSGPTISASVTPPPPATGQTTTSRITTAITSAIKPASISGALRL